jgi:hypothetical protein
VCDSLLFGKAGRCRQPLLELALATKFRLAMLTSDKYGKSRYKKEGLTITVYLQKQENEVSGCIPRKRTAGARLSHPSASCVCSWRAPLHLRQACGRLNCRLLCLFWLNSRLLCTCLVATAKLLATIVARRSVRLQGVVGVMLRKHA